MAPRVMWMATRRRNGIGISAYRGLPSSGSRTMPESHCFRSPLSTIPNRSLTTLRILVSSCKPLRLQPAELLSGDDRVRHAVGLEDPARITQGDLHQSAHHADDVPGDGGQVEVAERGEIPGE